MTAFREDILKGKIAFVAGGTSGINLGIAKRFAELGASVAVLGRDSDKASRAAREVGPTSVGFSADVRNYGDVRRCMEDTVARFGRMDIVVSGAAGNFLAPAEIMSANAFRTVVDIDLNGTFNVFRACYDLLATPGASLIAITAGQAVNAIPLQAHACAAKAGVNQLVRVLAMEWGPGVRVNGISPGPIAGTEGMKRLAVEPSTQDGHRERIPLKRWGTIEEVAECAVFICSSAASYVTGTILDCDGGFQLGDAAQRGLVA